MQAEKILVPAPRGIPASMVEAYVRRCRTALSDAEAALGRLDHNHLRVYGHGLKGSGAGYGIPRLTEMGSLIEQAAKRGDTAELQAQLGAMELYLRRIEIVPG